jgi:hypothetical protein
MKITFTEGIYELHRYSEPPQPAKSLIPEWYKKIPTVDVAGANQNNLKLCVPFLDVLLTGYIQTTWSDIHVSNVNGEVTITQSDVLPHLQERPYASMEVSNKYAKQEFVWQRYWVPKLPKGYSLLITQPFNRFDLPFTSVSGIVDLDMFEHKNIGNYPVYFHSDFEGVIPKGTPMVQMIPIKRENWAHEIKKFNAHKIKENNVEFQDMGKHAYKKNFWKRKVYQ